MNRRTPIKTLTAYKYIFPIFLFFCIAIIVPLVVAFVIGFTSWRGGSSMEFVGLENYIKVMKDDDFWEAFLHNIQFILTLFVFQIGVAFVLAIVYQSSKIKFKELHRRVVFMPAVLSAMVVGMIWSLVYRTDIGFLAEIMRRIGLEDYILPWLDSPDLVIWAICITLGWQFVGQFSIILTAGMTNVGSELLEAAEIDGANVVQRAVHITFPLLKPTIAVCMTMCIAGCMKLFDIVLVMSGGGPGTSSMVTALYAYQTAMLSSKFGYSSALAICMAALSLVMIIIMRKVLLKGGKDEK